MKSIYSVIILFIIIFLNSCAPVYKCGDAKPAKTPITWSKNLKTVVTERDRLCNDLASSKRENTGLKNTVSDYEKRYSDLTAKNNDLTARYNDLDARHKSLIGESLSKTDQLSRALQAKSDELRNKELLLLKERKPCMKCNPS